MPAESSRRAWPALGSVRLRITAIATLIVAVALVGAGFLLVSLQREALTDNVRATIRLRAADVASAVAGGAPPESFTVSDDEVALVQVLDESGQIVAASPNIRGQPPVIDDRPPPGERTSHRVDGLPLDDEPFEVVARGVASPTGSYTVIVAGSLEDVEESIAALTGFLQWGIPVLLIAVGLGTWIAVGRALSPVEGIRREVAAIETNPLDRRVPVPRTNDEISRLARTMNEMLERLQVAYARQDEFVADAAHELRSPLAAIRTQLEVDLANLPDAHAASAVEGLHAEVERMQRLTDDLLLLARSGAGRGVPSSTLVDLDDVVLDEARRARNGGRVDVSTAAVSGAQVRGDALQLRRAARNLIDNATRHATVHVVLDLEERSGQAVLVVTDDGPGIPADQRERVFERFSRVESARARDDGGAGLGLAITRAIARSHGGDVTVDSAYTAGARFVLTIPCADREPHAARAPMEPEA